MWETMKTIARTLLLWVALASVAAAQDPSGDFVVRGVTRDGQIYRGRVSVERDGAELVLRTRTLEGAPQRPDARSAPGWGSWRFEFPWSEAPAPRPDTVGIARLIAGPLGAGTLGGAPPASARSASLELISGPHGTYHGQLREGGEVMAQERWFRTRNDLVVIAMGDYGKHEIWDLRAKGVATLGIYNSPAGEDKLTVDGQTYDLSLDGVHEVGENLFAEYGTLTASDFLDHEGVAGARKERLLKLITRTADRKVRDEVGQVVRTFLQAERGERTLERLILSGHSIGSGVWGDNNGYFELDLLEAILAEFPEVAPQIEDVMIAGCYSGRLYHLERYRRMFPNLVSFWGYGASAPGTWSGAMIHNQRWEQASRGHDPAAVVRTVVAGTRKGENVATWNVVTHFMPDTPARPLAEVLADLDQARPAYAEFLAGTRVQTSTQHGELRDTYTVVQEALGMPSLPSERRAELEPLRDQCIRLIYFEVIREKFVANYGAEVAAGYAALGHEAPAFAELSRLEALAAIAAFEAACAEAGALPPAAERARTLLTEGLRDLGSAVIPTSWV